MSGQKQSETPETQATPDALSNEELDGVVGGQGRVSVPAVQGVHHPTAPGQQKGIIAVLIG